MNCDPTDIIEELLGERAHLGFDPDSKHYQCPFIHKICPKRSTADKTKPYPVCTLRKVQGGVIAVCPKRFYERDFLRDVVEHAWFGNNSENLTIVSEIKMEGFGNVDFVIADLNGDTRQFLSVELQAIDITGSVRPAYDAIVENRLLDKRPTYGFNWKNVVKRYINQLIAKGYYHHHWGTRIVAAIQDEVFEYFRRDADFPTTTDLSDVKNVNIVFMVYGFEPTNDGKNREQKLVLKQVVGTHHSNLQNAILYKTPPDKNAFWDRIEAARKRQD